MQELEEKNAKSFNDFRLSFRSVENIEEDDIQMRPNYYREYEKLSVAIPRPLAEYQYSERLYYKIIWPHLNIFDKKVFVFLSFWSTILFSGVANQSVFR